MFAAGIMTLALLQAAAPPLAERSLLVTLTDEKGAPVQGLTRDEVVVMESGQARAVSRFERDERPIDLAVLVDTSQPMAALYRLNVVDPVIQFLGRLPPGSRFTAWTTGDRPTRVAEFGDDPAVVARALKRAVPSGGNTVLDAIVEAARDLKSQEGRRPVLLIVTGTGIGFTNSDRRQVVDDAMKTGVQVLALQFDESGDPDVQAAGSGQVTRQDYDYVLSELTRRSGGRLERILSALGVRNGLDRLAAELEAQYRLSYHSDASKDQKVEVQVARPGVKVRWSTRPS